MNLRILSRLLGSILLVISIAMALCAGLAYYELTIEVDNHAFEAMGLAFLTTIGFAGLLIFLGRKASPEDLLRKEAIAIVSLGWLLAAIFGSLPFALYQEGPDLIHSFFESMSGFTTTGSTIIADLESVPDSILLWRSLTQWIGGLGILALIVALLSFFGVNGKSLFGAETSMSLSDSPTARVKDLTFRLWLVYGCLTILCWVGLILIGGSPERPISTFDALLYSLATVSTGGFAPHDASVGYFDSPWIEGFLCIFMIISSLSMVLVVNLAQGQWHRRKGKSEAVGYLSLLLFAWLSVSAILWLNGKATGFEAFRQALFPVVSLSTSTGFGTTDYDQWPLLGQLILMMLMIIGGCTGSTSGGVKMLRVIVMVRVLLYEVRRTFRPKQMFCIRIDGQPVDNDSQRQLVTFLMFSAVLLLLSIQVVSLLEPSISDLRTAKGAVFGTFFNMGPGFGEVGPTDTFAEMHPRTLLFLSFLMLLGRLEIFVVVALFSRALWRRD